MSRIMAFPYPEGFAFLLSFALLTGFKAEDIALLYAEQGVGETVIMLLHITLIALLPAVMILLYRTGLLEFAYYLFCFDIDLP